jgi:hypothetical protein
MSQVKKLILFLDLLVGKEPLNDLPELPKLKSVAQWDGQDAKLEKNEDL